jgi:hypothetical protein
MVSEKMRKIDYLIVVGVSLGIAIFGVILRCCIIYMYLIDKFWGLKHEK